MVRERRIYSAGGKLPESTGDKLPDSTGDKLPESIGEMVQLSWGNFWTVLGKWLHWMSGIPPGNNLILRLPGMLT